MTVIRPNSVSGITSITAQANEINFFRSNGTLAGLQLNGVNFNTTTGISTLAALKITGNLDVEGVLTYQDVTNVDSVGIVTARQGVRVTADGSPSSNYISVGASNDLKIYHSGSHSRILDDATGKLQLGSDTEVEILNGSFNESMAKFQPNGAVELYHNNERKIYTHATGIQVEDATSTGASIVMSTSSGTSGSLYATGNNTLGLLDGQNHYMLKGVKDGALELYHDNTKKFETKSNGAQVFGLLEADTLGLGDNDVLQLGNLGIGGNLRLYHNTSNSYIDNQATGHIFIRNNVDTDFGANIYIQPKSGENSIAAIHDGTVELYYNNIKQLATHTDAIYIQTNADQGRIRLADTSGNIAYQITGQDVASSGESGGRLVIQDANGGIFLDARTSGGNCFVYNTIKLNGNSTADNLKLIMGISEDFQLYHNGTDSYLQNSTGKLRVRNTHADEIKLDTNNTTRWNIGGTGHIYPDLNNTYDIGTTTYRVRNIYTNDLNLSNEGGKNDVDGTWGNYTIQEGESDLFLINKRNGKKYKFNLTEVS